MPEPQTTEKAQRPDAFRHSNGKHHFESFLAGGIACTNPALGCTPVWFSETPPSITPAESTGRNLPFVCCPHCGCVPGDRLGHDDTCVTCQNPDGTPASTESGVHSVPLTPEARERIAAERAARQFPLSSTPAETDQEHRDV